MCCFIFISLFLFCIQLNIEIFGSFFGRITLDMISFAPCLCVSACVTSSSYGRLCCCCCCCCVNKCLCACIREISSANRISFGKQLKRKWIQLYFSVVIVKTDKCSSISIKMRTPRTHTQNKTFSNFCSSNWFFFFRSILAILFVFCLKLWTRQI